MLSIIIPCYNCEKTLEEAVNSCFKQNLGVPFEIVMVDDGSTDGTRTLMELLAKRHKEIKLFFHKKNRGGGATRNTAVEHSQADIIFCLDSDDILPAGTLKKMFVMLIDKKCDGVGIQTSIKFKGTDMHNTVFTNEFGYVNERIPFESLLEKDGQPLCSLYSTFMFTKRAFEIAGGYPTDDGFDTQGFAWRFLANNLVAYTCPNSSYLHRIQFNKSYYIREYESGKVNHNWFKILQEFLYLFSIETQEFILKFDLNNQMNLYLFDSIKKRNNALKPDYKQNIRIHGPMEYEKKVANELTEKYWLGTRKLNAKKYHEAFTIFEDIIRNGLDIGYAHYYLDICSKKIQVKSELINQEKIRALSHFSKHGSKLNIFVRLYRKIRNWHINHKKIEGFILHVQSRMCHPHLLYYFLLLRLKKIFGVGFDKNSDIKYEKIDVVIPTLPKDLILLSRVVKSLSQLSHVINNIYIIAPAKEEIIKYSQDNKLVFIDEKSILGYGKESIRYEVDGVDRSGWIFQQLLKLSAENICEMDDYFVLDSDTIICSSFRLIEDGRFIFYQNEEWHQRYFDEFKRLFGYPAKNKLSFTSHMMIFNKKMLQLMKKELEEKHGKSWDQVYLSTIDDREPSCVSDYDTYANWVLCNFPDRVIQKPLYNKSFSRRQLGYIENNINKYAKKYKTISFHSYIK